jgi:phosphatidylserine decarboxylase
MNTFSSFNPPRRFAIPVARAGYPVIFSAVVLTVVFAWFGFLFLTIATLFVTVFTCYFFRDPDRTISNHAKAVVAPADGKIVKAERVDRGPFNNDTCVKISIFMSVFNVHVNRIPYAGNILKLEHRPGKFFSAHLDKASRQNEQNSIFLETDDGNKISLVQVAGLIARRILCKIQVGESVGRGQRFGMICFGSRVDIYLPVDADVHVSVGNRVKAGISILGYLS